MIKQIWILILSFHRNEKIYRNKEKMQKNSKHSGRKPSPDVIAFRKETENEFLHYIKLLLLEGIPILQYSFLSIKPSPMILFYQPHSQTLLLQKPSHSFLYNFFCFSTSKVISFDQILKFYILDRYSTFSKEEVDRIIFFEVRYERFDHQIFVIQLESSVQRNTLYEGLRLLLQRYQNRFFHK